MGDWEPVTERDAELFEKLGVAKHFPPALTDGKWEYKIDDEGFSIFELKFRKVKGMQWMGLDQIEKDLNYDAKDRAAYFITVYDDDHVPTIKIGFINREAFEATLPTFQETIQSHGENLAQHMERVSTLPSSSSKGEPDIHP